MFEQLNSYLVQLPCWFYSPSASSITTLANVLFTKADLVSHVLWLCPLQWQDQFNLHKKGMTPVDMHSLLLSLEAIKCLCTQEKSHAQSIKKASNKGEEGNKQPVAESKARVPKKAHIKKHHKLCNENGGAHNMHNTRDCCKYEKDRKEKPDFCAAKKGGKKPNPARQNFAQLREKLNELEKAL